MSGILNVNSAYNLESNKMQKKLNFEVGEKFLARIIKLSGKSNEIVLKLLDGWQFSAKLDKLMEFIPDSLVKFEVEGYEDGKLLLKLVQNENKESTKNLFEDVVKNTNIKMDSDEYQLLEKMLKHNMPLTKENISTVKTLVDFQNKIIQDNSEEDNFILKYLTNKNIDIHSDKGQNIKNILKGFFNQFKKISSEDLFTLIENNIDLTEENITSFNKVTKESMTIYKDVMDLEQVIPKKAELKEQDINSKSIDKNTIELDKNVSASSDKNSDVASKTDILKNSSENKSPANTNAYVKKDNDVSTLKEGIIKESNGKDTLVELLQGDTQENDNAEQTIKKDIMSKEIQTDKLNMQLENDDEVVFKIKEQIDKKIDEMKQIVKQFIDDELDIKSDAFNKLIDTFKNKMNDFKVYNSLSNQYYYLDIPVNIKDKEYPCKLIVKDERKKGKKIDSKNVRLVASVKTINMGVVDAYIKVLNKNMDVNIKCHREWLKLINIGKHKIVNKLNELGYISNIKVEEKAEKVDIVECRTFFEDEDFTRIDKMV